MCLMLRVSYSWLLKTANEALRRLIEIIEKVQRESALSNLKAMYHLSNRIDRIRGQACSID